VAVQIPESNHVENFIVSETLVKEVRLLKTYAIVATIVCAALFTLLFLGDNKTRAFEEIDVERINIVEKSGELRMVISNQERQHPGIVNGKIIQRETARPPGMIFFNHLGDEMGGLIMGENGGDGHFGSLTFDKVRGDQTIGFRHMESDNGTYTTGLVIWQQPDIPSDIINARYQEAIKLEDEAEKKAAIQAMKDNNELTTERLFLGKNRDDTSYLVMSDIKGDPRIVMSVTADGTSRLEFWDETGEAIYSLPE
jgi:hypothetical protein